MGRLLALVRRKFNALMQGPMGRRVWSWVVILYAVGLAFLFLSPPTTIVVLDARSERIGIRVDDAAAAVIPVPTPGDDGCTWRHLHPTTGATVTVLRTTNGPLWIVLAAPFGKHSAGTVEDSAGQVLPLQRTESFRIDKPIVACNTRDTARIRIAVRGALTIGDELAPPRLSHDTLAAQAPLLLLDGEIRVYARGRFSFGAPTIYDVATIRLTPGSRMPLEHKDAREIIWWGFIEPSYDDQGALRVAASTVTRELRVFNPSSGSAGERFNVSVLTQLGNDPLLVMLQLFLALLISVKQLLE